MSTMFVKASDTASASGLQRLIVHDFSDCARVEFMRATGPDEVAARLLAEDTQAYVTYGPTAEDPDALRGASVALYALTEDQEERARSVAERVAHVPVMGREGILHVEEASRAAAVEIVRAVFCEGAAGPSRRSTSR